MRRSTRALALAAAAIAVSLCASATMAQSRTTTITFPWDWHISAAPNVGGPTNPVPGDAVEIWLWGTSTINFGQPQLVDVLPGFDPMDVPTTFDLGPGGGLGAPIPNPVPQGGIYNIPIELVSMDLRSMMPVAFPGGTSDVNFLLGTTQHSGGALQNLTANPDGSINVDSFFDIFFDIELPQAGMRLTSGPVGLGMSFGNTPGIPGVDLQRADPLPKLDTLWAPTWVWRTFPPGQSPPWVDQSLHPWDWWVTIHGHPSVPEPSSLVLGMIGGIVSLLYAVRQRKRRATTC